MSSEEPEWRLATDSPRLFFELSEDATRSELRRKYAALIRRFKPETHPNQFMVIRSAFERLDALLQRRYDDSNPLTRLVDHVSPSHTQSADHQRAGTHQDGGTLDVRAEELARRISTEALRSLLLSEAARIGDDRFYHSMWESLTEYIVRVDFEHIGSLLASTGRLVDDPRYDNAPVHRTSFYVSILPYLLFRCPEDWVAQEIRSLEANADLLPSDHQFDLVLELFEYWRRNRIERELHDRQDPVLAEQRIRLEDRIRAVFSQPHRFSQDELLAGHLAFSAPDGMYDQLLNKHLEQNVSAALMLWIQLLQTGIGHAMLGNTRNTGDVSLEIQRRFVADVQDKWRDSAECRKVQAAALRYRLGKSSVIAMICFVFAGVALFPSLLLFAVVSGPVELIAAPLVGQSAANTLRNALVIASVSIVTIGTFVYAWQSSQMTIAGDGHYWVRSVLADHWARVAGPFQSMLRERFHLFVQHQHQHQHQRLGTAEFHVIFDLHADSTADAWLMTPEAVREFGYSLAREPIALCWLLGADLCKLSPDIST